MEEAGLNANDARSRLYEILRKDLSFEGKAREALELGRQYLNADNGHLTRIDTETDHWEAAISTDPPDGQFPAGLALDLNETYCRRTIQSDDPIALHDAPAQGWADDPAYETHGLHCYHGTTLYLDDEPYGTICFVAEDARREPFSDGETMFAELTARLLERELERKQHEAELTRRTNLVNVLNRVLRHNLRNDMSVIRGHARLMADRLGDDVSGETAITKIDKLLALSQKARNLERIIGEDTGRAETDIGALVNRVGRAVGESYPNASISVQASEDITAAVAPSFERAIRELIENAAKHAGPNPTVTITIENVPNAVEIRIADTGPGLNEQERNVLTFGVETPLVHGSGLGLWLVHWIVTSHDGSVEPSVTEDGTTMSVSIPRSQPTSDMPELAEIRKARDRYQAAFEEAFEAVVIIDDDARIIEANSEAGTLYGLDRTELLGRPIPEFLPPNFDFEAAWADFKNSGSERDIVTIHGADGVNRQVEYSATTDIVPGQHLIIGRDVSERIEREQQLAQTETVFENTQDAIFLIDVTDEEEFRVERVNSVYEELTGISNAEIQGKTPQEVVGDEIGSDIEAHYRECAERRETIKYPEKIPVDGELRHWQTKLTPVIRDGDVVQLVGAMRDVTDQKERQEQLRAQRERFERLLDTSPVGITILDPDGRIRRANKRAEKVLGLSRSAIIGREYDAAEWEIVDADGNPIPAEELPFSRVMQTGEPVYDFEHGIRRVDGKVRWLSINAAPLTDSEGEVERVITAITKITELAGNGPVIGPQA